MHHRRSDCWLAVGGSVYDMTPFLKRHPGGELLAIQAGEDASAMVLSNHPFDIERALRAYRVGAFLGAGRALPIKTSFLRSLQRRVVDELSSQGRPRGDIPHKLRGVAPTLLLWAASWIGCYAFGLWPLAVVMGLASCSLVGSFAHEHAHGLLFSPRRGSLWIRYGVSSIWAALFPTMLERHFQLEHFRHHEAPMDPERDYELVAIAPFMRLSPAQKWRRLHAFQHRTAPLVYALYITIQFINGFFGAYFDGRKLSREWAFAFENYVAPLLSLAVHVLIPLYIGHFGSWLVSFLLFMTTWQAMTYFVAAVPHMTRLPPSESATWAEWVCKTTCNLRAGAFMSWLAGGFDHQIEHHLLPFVPRAQLPLIAPIVQSACAESGYAYTSYSSLGAYFEDHYAVLASLRHAGDEQ